MAGAGAAVSVAVAVIVVVGVMEVNESQTLLIDRRSDTFCLLVYQFGLLWFFCGT